MNNEYINIGYDNKDDNRYAYNTNTSINDIICTKYKCNNNKLNNALTYPYDESLIQPFVFYLPVTLDLPYVLKLSGNEYWLKHVWKLYYILTIVYRGRWNKENDEDDFNYTIINIKTLRRVVGDKFATEAMRLLIRLGIIESNRHYIPGHKSKGYKFTKEYDNYFEKLDAEELAQVPPRLLNRIPRINLKTPEHVFLFENLQKISLHNSVNEFWPDFKPKSQRQNDYYRKSVDFVKIKDWSFFCDNVTGRVFNNVTSLPKLLRPFLLLDGQPVIEIDVANCQPFLLLSLYEETDNYECEKFKSEILSGKFYEFLNNLQKHPYPEREQAKNATYKRILFGSLKQKRYNYYKVFAAQFPILDKKIDEIKTPRYQELARILQTLEADIMINGVIRKIANTTRIPVLTVHDSIITLPQHKKQVMELLECEFKEKFGVVPILREKGNKLIEKLDLPMAA
jgi:hypothetical protein